MTDSSKASGGIKEALVGLVGRSLNKDRVTTATCRHWWKWLVALWA
jgi:hypothetical protein